MASGRGGDPSAVPLRATAMRAILPDGQVACAPCTDLPALSSPLRKNILFFRNANHRYIRSRPVPTEGRYAIVTFAGRDAVDADAPITNGVDADVRSRVVLTPRRWCQVCEKERSRRWPKSPEHRGDHGVAVKTIAWGMPGDSGVTYMLVCALPLPLHTRPWAHRAPGIPCALNSERAGINEHLAKKPFGEIAKLCLVVIVSAMPFAPSSCADCCGCSCGSLICA
jgi:hypothetical protein